MADASGGKDTPMTLYSVLQDPANVGHDSNARVAVIVSDDDGRSWRPYTPVFPAAQSEVAFTIAAAMNASAASFQMRLLEDA
jgi:hypothetical protein